MKRERNLQLSGDVNKQDVYLRTLKVKHEEEKQDLICKVDSMQDIIDGTKQENNEIQRLPNQKLTESLRRNVELMKEIGNLKETLDSSDRNSSSENSNKIKDVSRLQTELTDANARITSVQDEVVNLQEQNDKLISENKEIDKINKEMLTTIEVLTIESSLYKSELDKMTAQVGTSNESIESSSQCTIREKEMTSRHEQLGENIEEKLYRRIYYRLKMDLLEELSQQRPISGTDNDNKEKFLGDTARNSRMKPDLENTKDTRTQKTYLQAAAGSKEMTKRDEMRQKIVVDNQQQMLNDMKKVQNSSKDERGRSNFHHGNTPKQRQESVGQKTKDNTGNENETITINVNKKEIRRNRLEPSNQLNNSKRGEFKSPKESSSRIRDQNDINVSTLKQNKKTSSIYGSMTESSRLKAYMPLSHIHISKVRLENDAQDIIEYVKNKIPNTDVECEEVKVKSGMYKSFKLSLPANCSSKLLQSSFWPESVAVRKFRNFEKNFQMKQNAVQKT